MEEPNRTRSETTNNSTNKPNGASWAEKRATFSAGLKNIKGNPFRRTTTIQQDATGIESKQEVKPSPPTPITSGTSTANSNISEYEQYLERAKSEDFTQEKNYGFLYPSGTDTAGRPIFVVIAAHFPSEKSVNLDRLLLYVISVMDQAVERDYSIVYVQTPIQGGTNSTPSFSWLRKAYRILSRKYKKNLKSLYIIHPTMWVKGIMRFFKPFVSNKFWQKLTYIEDVSDIHRFIHKDQLKLPSFVLQNRAGSKKSVPVFGTPLEDVLNRGDHTDKEIPIVVEKSVEYLMDAQANTVQGIFRLSGSNQQIQQLRKDFDKGETVDLKTVDDPHVVAGLLKLYLREMPEPLFPFEFYDRLISSYKSGSGGDAVVNNLYALLVDLPPANKALLKCLLNLLSYIEANASVNQMTSSNLSIVFAPNIIRSGHETMQEAILHTPIVNSVVRILVENHQRLLPALDPPSA